MFISYSSMKTLLISGANGFLGTELINLLSQNENYNLVLNSYSSPNDFIKNIINSRNNVKFIKSDITNTESVYDIVLRSDYVFHLASIVGKNLCEENIYNSFDTNVMGSLNIFKACKDANKKITFLSIPNLDDYSLYALSKSCSDRFAQMYLNLHGLDISIIRLFNCYGYSQNDKSGKLIINTIKNALSNKPIKVHGNGDQILNFIHIDDVVRVLSDLVNNHNKGIFYLGSNTELTVNEVVKKIISITNSNSQIIYEDNRIGDTDPNIIMKEEFQRLHLNEYKDFDQSIIEISSLLKMKS